MSASDEDAYARRIRPIGALSEQTLAQLLGLNAQTDALARMKQEMDDIRDSEMKAEQAVANVRLY